MSAHVIDVVKDPGDAVDWNACLAEVDSVSGPGIHNRSTTTPGHIAAVTRSTAVITSGESGEAGEICGLSGRVTRIRVSESTRVRVARVASGESPGSRRHWMVACARWGKAFSA